MSDVRIELAKRLTEVAHRLANLSGKLLHQQINPEDTAAELSKALAELEALNALISQ
jgi:hypothetical protein